MNISNKHPISFDRIERSDIEANKVTVFVKMKGISYKFIVVDSSVKNLSDEELKTKFGAQFAALGRVARVVDLKIGEKLLQKGQDLTLQGRNEKMKTRSLGDMKITLPKSLAPEKLEKIGRIYNQNLQINQDITEKTTKITKKNVLSLQQDIICKYSQGQFDKIAKKLGIKEKHLFDNNEVSQACSCICMEAVKDYLSSGHLPKNELDIYRLIFKGVENYKSDENTSGQLFFGDVLAKLPAKDKDNIISLKLPVPDGFDELEGQTELSYPATSLLSTLNFIQDRVGYNKSSSLNECAVITTQSSKGTNPTLVVMFDEERKPVLFNSHGSSFQGEPRGASLRKFQDMEKLNDYLHEEFFKGEEDEMFQINFLSTVIRGSESTISVELT